MAFQAVPAPKPITIVPNLDFRGYPVVAIMPVRYSSRSIPAYGMAMQMAADFRERQIPLVFVDRGSVAGVLDELRKQAVVFDAPRSGPTTEVLDAVRFIQAHGGDKAHILELHGEKQDILAAAGFDITSAACQQVDIAVIGRTQWALDRLSKSRRYTEQLVGSCLQLLGLPPDPCNQDRLYSPRGVQYLLAMEYLLRTHGQSLNNGLHRYITVIEAQGSRLYACLPAEETERLQSLGRVKIESMLVDLDSHPELTKFEDQNPGMVAQQYNTMLRQLAWMLHLYQGAPKPMRETVALLRSNPGFAVE